MNEDESMYSLYMELSSIRKKLATIQEQKETQKKKKFVAKINDKLEKFSFLIKTINEHQERINSKKHTIVYKMPEKSLSTNNSLQLAYTHHDDFVNITLSKPKIEELINDYQICVDKTTDLKYILNEFQNVNSTWRTNFFEQLCEYRSAKGLLDNIQQLKTIDKKHDDTSLYEQSDSDLGCYPNDITVEEDATALLYFATSSPIINK